MYSDYHLHTIYSDDSSYPMASLAADAFALGLDEICITDHVDYGLKRDTDDPRGPLPPDARGCRQLNVDYSAYFREISVLQEMYAGKIRIRAGLEYGMQTHTLPKYEALSKRYPLDFILLSVHELDDLELYTGDYQRGKVRNEIYSRYYQELTGLVRKNPVYSCLAHLDLIKRYDPEGPMSYDDFRDQTDLILKTVIENGKGIELNTSSRRYHLSESLPSEAILRRYIELGGEILTIGSDAHEKAYLADGILEARAYLRSLGCRYFATFDQMKPVFHRL